MDELIIDLVTRYPVVTTIVAGLVAFHAFALFVVNLTPTPKDDNMVAKVYRVVEYAAGVITSKSKEGKDE